MAHAYHWPILVSFCLYCLGSIQSTSTSPFDWYSPICCYCGCGSPRPKQLLFGTALGLRDSQDLAVTNSYSSACGPNPHDMNFLMLTRSTVLYVEHLITINLGYRPTRVPSTCAQGCSGLLVYPLVPASCIPPTRNLPVSHRAINLAASCKWHASSPSLIDVVDRGR